MKPEDLEVTAIRPDRIGGQHVGSVHNGVRVKHKPTGICAECEAERSQHRNRAVATEMVEWGLLSIGWK